MKYLSNFPEYVIMKNGNCQAHR